MKKTLVMAAGLIAIVLWTFRNSAGIGEWLRVMSDIPTNALLLGTSGFEKEGVDPAKAG
jgi:hypothetical protein